MCTQLEKICWFVFFSDLNIRSKAKLKFFIVSLAFNGCAILPVHILIFKIIYCLVFYFASLLNHG